MRLTKIKLAGFKSFVDPTTVSFPSNLTGVVGPNGCGKSNLLEAIRWVMGESSAKSMRGGGMEDVIFAGTEGRPPRAFAEVVLLAEDDSREELEVVRRIERGAGSAYRINGKDARAKDVALVFADAATGAHSPALVSQGRIASVISAKPAERRLMLEEAAGIAGLHVRRKDAEQKLRATETNLARLEDIMAGLDRQIGGLRRQARAAERYKALSDRIRVAEARLVFARWRDAARSADFRHAMDLLGALRLCANVPGQFAIEAALNGIDTITPLCQPGGRAEVLHGQRIEQDDVHGTGCALSTAIATHLALGMSLSDACAKAKAFVAERIAHPVRPGRGAPAVV